VHRIAPETWIKGNASSGSQVPNDVAPQALRRPSVLETTSRGGRVTLRAPIGTSDGVSDSAQNSLQ
jgi:hypothetical protein